MKSSDSGEWGDWHRFGLLSRQSAGHEVTVLDRQPAAGLETSFANAGEVSPGYAAAPGPVPAFPMKGD